MKSKQRKIFQTIPGNVIYYFINGYKYTLTLGADFKSKSIRYVSFAASTYNFDSQDFYYECAEHSAETENMGGWTDTDSASYY